MADPNILVSNGSLESRRGEADRESTSSAISADPRQSPFDLLNYNVHATIENPLARLTPSQLRRNVGAFAREHHLTEKLNLLEKGAQVARDPMAYMVVSGLNDEERRALGEEESHPFRQPRALWLTIVVCSIGAIVQGWDQTVFNGANLTFPHALGIYDHAPDPNLRRNTWLVGLINAASFLSSACLGSLLTDPLNNLFGRRGTIFFSGIFCLFPVLGSAFSQTWQQLLVCRLLLGIGMGAKASTVSVYAAENSPPQIRGSLVLSWQMWTAFGILLSCSANLAVYNVGSISWRLQLGSAFIPAIPLLIGIYFCPESPRWYIKKKRYADAYRSLCRLRNTELQAARDLYRIHAQLLEEARIISDSNYITRISELFTIPRVRRATLATFVVMSARQLCGINIIVYYSSRIFADAHANPRKALLASWGGGLLNFVFAWPAFRTVDSFGRRSLLLFTFPHMAWTMLAAGLCFYIPDKSPAHLGLVVFFVYLFIIFYSVGEGPVPFIYASESFPLSHREAGMAFGVFTNHIWATVILLTYIRIDNAAGHQGAFGCYAALNVVSLIMIFLWMPETKQRTLEELDYIFAVPTQKHVNYQVTIFLPWLFRRWVLLRREAELAGLYKFEDPPEEGEGVELDS